jgi:hypothetical protein
LLAHQSDESLLLAIRSNKSVDLSNLNIESVLEGLFNLGLGSLESNDEDKSILLFHEFGGSLSSNWVLNDGK